MTRYPKKPAVKAKKAPAKRKPAPKQAVTKPRVARPAKKRAAEAEWRDDARKAPALPRLTVEEHAELAAAAKPQRVPTRPGLFRRLLRALGMAR